jgi:hypothetical protein
LTTPVSGAPEVLKPELLGVRVRLDGMRLARVASVDNGVARTVSGVEKLMLCGQLDQD